MTLSDLVARFQYQETLDSNSQLKTLVLLGTIDSEPAILSFEKTHFNISLDELESNKLPIISIKEIESNDVYHWGMNLLESNINTTPSSKINLIYPATETHIRKFNKPKFHVIVETPELYQSIVKPYIESMKGDRIKWVKNILYEGAEADKVIYKNDKFILIPDMKWDGVTLDNLYCCCIVYRDDISSIRDLNINHLQYLQDISNDLKKIIPEKYPIKANDLRIFVHYQPSYYHFHIHIVNVNYSGLGESILAGKAILLQEVIDNLRFLGEKGYSQKTMTYVMNENHKLWELGMNKCV
ncbi:hypothetical protein CANARDRAFT_28738 [[Candida] arabinofermentans NRRL YB-2248]|uniref:HIT domain-containing protein n=1 Tax=[Candida] arabinofermentans NRRL YB-2248 TaxID=983967 RepID=A0A1E4SZV1_9ASCO|nr:hypothetical protein CANARDRAFT_28738 [[Candida] arabinofermentans NRRL YB-2248]